MASTDRLRGLVLLARPGNVIGAGVLTLVGAFVAAGTDELALSAAAIAATALGTAAGNAINDYFDREIDAINRPNRPIPSGLIAPKAAKYYAGGLFALAVFLTLALLPPAAIAIAAINLVLLTTYTQFFKATPGLGNAVVGFLVGSAIWFGGAAAGDLPATLVIGLLAGLATFSREVLKDMEDIPGDRSEGLATLPIRFGSTLAWRVAVLAMVVGALISPIPYLDGTFGLAYLIALVPALFVMGYGAFEGRTQPGRGQRLLKVGMYLALLAFLLGRVQLPV